MPSFLPRLAPAILTLLLFVLPPAAKAEAPPQHVRIHLVPERTTILPGETLMIAIRQEIDAGWHTYWANPGDSGEAMTVKWTLPPGFEAGNIQWPVPRRIETGPLVSFGYEGGAVMIQDIVAPADLPPGPLVLRAQIALLVCKDICIPETGEYEFTLNGAADESAASDNSALIDEATSALPVVLGWDAVYTEKDGDLRITLDLDAPGIAAIIGDPAQADFLPYESGLTDNAVQARISVEAGEGEDRVLAILKKRGPVPLPDESLRGLIVFRDQNGSQAAMELSAVKSASTKEGAEKGTGAGFFAAILFALAGGAVLNLMPCVFPVLSMKALSLARLPEKERKAARLLGLSYTAGVLVCFAGIAGLLIALRAAGTQAGWGFQLQNPAVVFVLAGLFFVIGLNLSGLFEFGGRLAGAGSKLAAKAGAAGSFFTGMLAAAVATPCTAPFMGAATGYALTAPPAAAMAVFLALGLGLALPYLALTFIPAVRHLLPKPGAWMGTLREFLAFPMYLSCAWLVWVYSRQTGENGVLYAALALTGIAFALWLARRAPAAGAGRHLALAAAALVALAAAAPGFGLKAGGENVRPGGAEITPYTAESFAALEAGDAPLFVNMTADWCITCKVNERAALAAAQTRSLFARTGTVYIEGDWTAGDPEITDFLARFGRNGVPLYVFYGARGKETGRRPDPVVLPQILTPGAIEALFGETEE